MENSSDNIFFSIYVEIYLSFVQNVMFFSTTEKDVSLTVQWADYWGDSSSEQKA